MVFCVEVGEDNVPFVQVGEHQLRLDLEELNEEYKERAKNELRETPEIIESALRKLREYIMGEPSLYIPLDDDKFLIKFLRPFKFYPESTFKVLKNFYKFRAKYPKYGMNLTPDSVRHVYDTEVFALLPTRTRSGSRIMIINAGSKWNPKLVTLQDMFRGLMIAIEIAMIEPKTQVAGVHVIINVKGFSLTHVCQFSPFHAKLLLDYAQECCPLRLKGIHIINQSRFVNMAYVIFKPFLGEKLRKRLHFHGANTLCEKISPESLPESIGGTGSFPEYPGKLLSEMFFYYEDLFKKYDSCGYKNEKIPQDD